MRTFAKSITFAAWAGLMLAVLSLSFLGCEIGLGAAIDTESPVVSVTTPDVNEAMGSTFSILGACTDDSKVESVAITCLRNNNDGTICYRDLGNAVLGDARSSWTIPLEYNPATGKYTCNGREIYLPDGTYIVDVTAYDASGRSSTLASRAFDIDNTPPVFLLTSPTALEGNPGTDYGRSVKITGTIADDHSIDYMEINAFDESGVEIPLSKTKFYDLDKSKTEVNIASYAPSATSEDAVLLHKNYLNLFSGAELDDTGNAFKDIDTVGTRNINLLIKLCDKAGNVSDYAYISSGLTSLSRGGESSSISIEASDFMKILNGTYSSDVLSADVQTRIREALKGNGDNDTYKYLSYSKDSGHKYLSMTVNPNNSPKFSVTGLDLKDASLSAVSTWRSIVNEAIITIRVTSGRDNVEFDPKTLSVKIFKSTADGRLDESDEFLEFEVNSTKNKDSLKDEKNTKSIYDIETTTTDSSYQLNLPNPGTKKFFPGNMYYVVVYGHDVNNVDLVPGSSANYGFTIVQTGTAPYVESDESGKYYKAASMTADTTFPITINDSQKELWKYEGSDALVYTVNYYQGHYNSVNEIASGTVPVASSGMKTVAYSSGTGLIKRVSDSQYTADIPLTVACPVAAKNYTAVITAKASNGTAGNESSFILYGDNSEPAVSVINTELVAAGNKKLSASSQYYTKDDSGEYYELRGNISDADGSGSSEVYVKIGSGEYQKATSVPQVTTPAAIWSTKLKITEQGEGKSISYYAVDKVGNKTAPVTIDGITIDFSIPEVALTSPYPLDAYYKDNTTIEFTATDGFKVSSISVVGKKDGVIVPEGDGTYKVSLTGTGTSTAKASVQIKGEGTWVFTAKATDASGQTSADCVASTTLDRTAPVIKNNLTVDGTPNNGFYTTTTLKIDGFANEPGSGVASVIYYIDLSDGTKTAEKTVLASSEKGDSVGFSITPTEFLAVNGGKNTIHVKLVDVAGNVGQEKTLEVKIDQASPTISAVYYDDGAGLVTVPNKIFYNSSSTKSMNFYGVVSDDGGIYGLSFKIGDVDVTPTILYTDSPLTDKSDGAAFSSASWKTYAQIANKSSIKGWKAVFTKDDVDVGALSVSATDLAGLITNAAVSCTFVNDVTPPVLTVTTPAAGGVITDENMVDDRYTVIGSWSDVDGSGTKTLRWSVDGTNYYEASGVPETTAKATWSFTIPKSKLTIGNGKSIFLKAIDSVGNISNVVQVSNLTVDYQKPTLAITKVNGSSSSTLDQYYNYNATSPLEVTLSSNDDWGVASVEVVSATRNGADAKVASPLYELEDTSSADKTTKVSIPRTGMADGKWKIGLQATDKAGRKSSIVYVETTVDGNKPAVDTSNYKVENNTPIPWYKNNILRIKAKATDDSFGSGLSTVYYKKSLSTVQAPSDITASSDGEVNIGGASTEFTVTVSDLNESDNSEYNVVYLQAKDNAGNVSGVAKISLKVDQNTPSIESKFYTSDGTNYGDATGTVMTNGKNDLTIYGNVSDSQSGLATIAFTNTLTDGTVKNLTATVTYSSVALASSDDIGSTTWDCTDALQKKSYKAVIEKAGLDSGTVKALATDVAGNELNAVLFNLDKDDTPPSLTLKNPITMEAGKSGTKTGVNGTISVEGSASDSSLASVTVSYSLTQDGAYTMVGTPITGSAAYNWTSSAIEMSKISGDVVKMIDGSDFNGTAQDVYIKVEAADTAANKTTKTFVYNVDPDTDRPVIKFSNIDVTGMDDSNSVWLKSNTIYGIVTDDDGVSKLEYATDPSGTWKNIELSNGSWSLTLNDEGAAKLYFRVTDAQGGVFTSKASTSSQYVSPKLGDDKQTLSSNSILNLKVDTKAPSVGTVYYQTSVDGSTWSTESSAFQDGHFGGKYKYVRFHMNANDTNGIASTNGVVFTLNGNDYGFDSVKSTENDNYYSESIDVSTFTTDAYTTVIKVTDAAGGSTEKSVSFMVDNTAPTVAVNGSDGVQSSASSIYGNINESGCDVYFAVTKNGGAKPSETNFASDGENGANKWKKITDASLSYLVYLDDGTSDNGTHTDLFKWYLAYVGAKDSGGTVATLENIKNGSYKENTKLDFHVMALDACGNTGYGKKTVTIDPQGDKPTVKITNPKDNQTLGGTISIMGTATDTAGKIVGVKGVGLLMDVDGDGDWDYDDIREIHTLQPSLRFAYYNTTVTPMTFNEVNFSTIPTSLSDYQCYALVTEMNGAAWELSVNENGEFNPADNQTRKVNLWAFAVDGDGNTSAIDVTVASTSMTNVSFTIDSDTPMIANEKLTKVADTSVTQSYSSGLAVKGAWYYEADIYDDTGISKITVDGASVVENGVIKGGVAKATVTELPSSFTEGKGFHIQITMGSDTIGDVFTDAVALEFEEKKDLGGIKVPYDVTLLVDNKAPELVPHSDDEFNITEYGAEKKRIANINGFYSFGSKASEAAVQSGTVVTNQTGVKRVAFYFTREVGGAKNIFDPMIAKNGSGNTLDYSTLTESDGLYWISKTASAVDNSATVTINSGSENIHRGGLVKVNGIIYRIESVTGTSVTLDSPVTISSSSTVYFALANVVDNTISEGEGTGEKNAAGYWEDGSYDDGDCMMEYLRKTGSNYTWTANINTKNIGDGLTKLHYVVFDAAGNFESDSCDVFVGNNLPRIAGVVFSTDDDGSGDETAYGGYSTNERYDYYSNLYEYGKVGATNITSAEFKIVDKNADGSLTDTLINVRNKMMVEPEVVGGNGKLSYTTAYSTWGASDWSGPTAFGSKTNLCNGDSTQLVGSTDDSTVNAKIEFTVKQMKGWSLPDGKEKLTFTISDETPGESMSADLSVIFNMALDDKSAPDIRIRPFYWKSSTDNSLFKESATNGHIELPQDLPDAKFAGASGEYDKDPKLSGKVKIEGVAKDESRITKITIKLGGVDKVLATYDKGAWTTIGSIVNEDIPATGIACEISKATYQDLVDSGIIDSVPDGVSASRSIQYFTQAYGHLVKWTAYVDTTKFLGAPTGLDKVISVVAIDRGTPSSSGVYSSAHSSTPGTNPTGGSDGAGAKTAYYKVDVVPYITTLKTSLTSINKKAPTTYSRGAKGSYPVYFYSKDGSGSKLGEKITIEGFNFGSGATVTLKGATATLDSSNSFSIPEVAVSGELSVTAGSVESLNNKNENFAKGSYTGNDATETYANYKNYYNRQPNNTNNARLDDDVSISVWGLNSKAATVSKGEMDEMVMHVNPDNGLLGFGYSQGGDLCNYPNGKDNSYERWCFGWTSVNTIGFIFDDEGNMFGVHAGTDTAPGGTKASRFRLTSSLWGVTSTWSQNDANTCYGRYNALRLEQMLAYSSSEGIARVTREDRFQDPCMASTLAKDKNSTNLYLMYYDSVYDELRFRAGKITHGAFDNTNWSSWNSKGANNFDDFVDEAWESDAPDKARTDNVTVIAGKNAANAGGYQASNVYSVGVAQKADGTDVVVAVWKDPLKGLVYSYLEDPLTNRKVGADKFGVVPAWKNNAKIIGQNVDHCAVAVDKDGHIHIATNSNGSLVYTYLDAYNSDFDASKNQVVVDGFGSAGSYLSLELAKDVAGGRTIPYISCYSDSTQTVKYAYLADSESSGTNGSTWAPKPGCDSKGRFTGAWEVLCMPTESSIKLDDIQIGVYKDVTTGVKKAIPDITTNASAGATSGKCGGNGTLNPVLGYQIVTKGKGFVETAQLK